MVDGTVFTLVFSRSFYTRFFPKLRYVPRFCSCRLPFVFKFLHVQFFQAILWIFQQKGLRKKVTLFSFRSWQKKLVQKEGFLFKLSTFHKLACCLKYTIFTCIFFWHCRIGIIQCPFKEPKSGKSWQYQACTVS